MTNTPTPATGLTLLTIERLLTIKAKILVEPHRYDQCVWAPPGTKRPDELQRGEEMCQSAGCIFGWAILLAGIPVSLDLDGAADDEDEVYCKAADWLGLKRNPDPGHYDYTPLEADRLYSMPLWPRQFVHRMATAGIRSPQSAAVAAERIDHFIATQGAE